MDWRLLALLIRARRYGNRGADEGESGAVGGYPRGDFASIGENRPAESRSRASETVWGGILGRTATENTSGFLARLASHSESRSSDTLCRARPTRGFDPPLRPKFPP